jgi:acyl-CoA synthetase (AMP-forming)/AMP-acid ligase II
MSEAEAVAGAGQQASSFVSMFAAWSTGAVYAPIKRRYTAKEVGDLVA